MEKLRDCLQLRYGVRAVATVLLQKGEDVLVLVAGVGLVQLGQLREHHLPGGNLLGGVVRVGDLLATVISSL